MALALNTARLSSVKPSATLEMARKARALKNAGVDVKNLSAGEPDFPTPACIREVAIRALESGQTSATHYTPARGTEDLVAAMCEKLKRDQGVEYAAEEVMATLGTKGALSLAIDALVGEGDEVIVFSPYWVTYPDLVRLAGGTPVTVETKAKNGFRPTGDDLERALSPRTRAVILNTPSNPTGAGYDRACLEELMGRLEGTDVWVISDEIYERLTYEGFEHVSPASLSDDARSRTLYVGGVAKAYAMTGWRVGVAAGPKPLLDAMVLLQGQRLTCCAAVAQAAAAYALREPPEVQAALSEMRETYARRRRQVLDDLRQIPGARVHAPEGAFYCFVDIRERLPGRHKGREVGDDITLATLLLEEAKVAVVPGTPFGAPGGLRLSFAASDETLREGVARIARWLEGMTREGLVPPR